MHSGIELGAPSATSLAIRARASASGDDQVPRGLSLVVGPPSSLSAGKPSASLSETCRRGRWGPSLPCPGRVSGSCVSPAWSLVSAVLFCVPQSLCQICNKHSSDVRAVSVPSCLVVPPTPGRRGVGGLSNSPPTSMSLSGEVGHPAGGACCPRLAPSLPPRPVPACPACLPLPPWVESQ